MTLSLYEFACMINEPGVDDCGRDLPCHTRRFYVYDAIKTKKLIEEYLVICKKHALGDNKELTLFSVTAEDEHHKLWLKVAEEKGFQVIETRSKHEGRYKCWMIFQQAHKPRAKKVKVAT